MQERISLQGPAPDAPREGAGPTILRRRCPPELPPQRVLDEGDALRRNNALRERVEMLAEAEHGILHVQTRRALVLPPPTVGSSAEASVQAEVGGGAASAEAVALEARREAQR